MDSFKQKYQTWLNQLQQAVQHATATQVTQLVHLTDHIKAYIKAGSDLTAYETQLFLETFIRQAEQQQTPELWPESLWQQLAQITDKTQVEWQEFAADLTHQGIYMQGEHIGMGVYCCMHCGEQITYNHPAELLSCVKCQGVRFLRRGLPV